MAASIFDGKQNHFKMKASLLLIMLVYIAISSSYGQIKGKITLNNKEPLPGATVKLIHLPDSIISGGQVTDNAGGFLFKNAGSGSYLISAGKAGFENAHSTAFPVSSGSTLTLPDIQLTETAQQLKEVIIMANIPQLEQKSDRLVVNLSNMNTTGDNALDVLKKAPGITLDKDDNILFRGNTGVNVMIDGKNTFMSGFELSSYLKTLPAGSIGKIELMANPPGNYDAEGTSGIINLIMKRNRALGYNGNAALTAGYGKYGKLSEGVNLNYNSGKLRLYSRFSEGYSNSYNKLTLRRQIENDLYNQTNYWHPVSNTTNYTLGADYFAGKKSTIGIMFKGYNSSQHADVTSESASYNSSGQQTSRVNGLNEQKTPNNTYNVNINYSLAIDSLGQKLSFDADYVHNNATDKESYVNRYSDIHNQQIGNPIYLRSMNMVGYNIYAVKGDYEYPFARTWRAEAGFKSSWVKTDNNAEFDSLKISGYVTDPLRSNHFLYAENINAAYITLGSSFGKTWDLKASMRMEQTAGHSVSDGQVIKRNYLNIFPSAFITYKFDADNQLNGSYSLRISRPNYGSLNPFVKYTDPYTAIAGNPYLSPSVSESLLIGYIHKSFQVISISYLKVDDAVSRVIYQDDQTKQSTSRLENLGTTRNLTATSAGGFNVVKWWNISYEVGASYNKVNTLVQGSSYNSEEFSWTGSTNQNFSLRDNFKLYLSAEYYSPGVNGLDHMLSSSAIDAGANKTFWNKKVTISFKARDIFGGRHYSSIIRYKNVNTSWLNEYESRKFSIGFTYLFGNSKLKTAGERKSGTASEEERL
jgi:hypothetical protein